MLVITLLANYLISNSKEEKVVNLISNTHRAPNSVATTSARHHCSELVPLKNCVCLSCQSRTLGKHHKAKHRGGILHLNLKEYLRKQIR